METDRVAYRDPALLHQSKRRESPACVDELGEKPPEQGYDIVFDSQSGETIGNDDNQIAGGRLKPRDGVWMKGPAKTRLAKIDSTVGRACVELEYRNGGFSENGECVVKALLEDWKVKRSMDSVSRLSVGELELEHLRRGDAMAGRRQRYSCGSKVTKPETRSRDEIGHGIGQFSKVGGI